VRRVVFSDAIEKMTQEIQKWVTGELLQAALDGRLSNVCFVLCGQAPPLFDPEMRRYVKEAELRPLSFEHIVEYLAKRGVEEAHRMPLAMALASRGNVLEIATRLTPISASKRSWADCDGRQRGSFPAVLRRVERDRAKRLSRVTVAPDRAGVRRSGPALRDPASI
jgi:hypothetical protein